MTKIQNEYSNFSQEPSPYVMLRPLKSSVTQMLNLSINQIRAQWLNFKARQGFVLMNFKARQTPMPTGTV